MAEKPFHNPFEALGALRDRLPASPEASAPVAKPAPQPKTPGGKTYARAVIHLERTGRGGKEVTIVDHLDLQPADRETWLKDLKAALGCGGVIEGSTIVLQGDHRTRLPALLAARGVKRV